MSMGYVFKNYLLRFQYSEIIISIFILKSYFISLIEKLGHDALLFSEIIRQSVFGREIET